MRGFILPSILLIVFGGFFGISKASNAQDLKLTEAFVTLDYQEALLKEVLKAVEDQTEFTFEYSYSAIDLNRQVSVTAQHESVERVLKHLFKNKPISWIQSGQSILLKK